MVTKNFGLKSLSSHLRKVRCRLAVFFKMRVVFVSLLENEKVAGDEIMEVFCVNTIQAAYLLLRRMIFLSVFFI